MIEVVAEIIKEHRPVFATRSGEFNELEELVQRIGADCMFYSAGFELGVALIKPEHAYQELFDGAVAEKEFVTLKGAGHNDAYILGGEDYFAKFRSFCAKTRELG